MYEKFFNLEAEPFEHLPDRRFFFDHQSYSKARIYLSYASQFAEGHVLVRGLPGAGKTTLIHQLLESIPAERVKIVSLDCSQLIDKDVFKSVAEGLGLDYRGADQAEFLQQLDVTLQHWRHQGTRALVILDEAHLLTAGACAQLGLLTSLQERGIPLLQIFFVGQPELDELMSKPAAAQLHEHIIANINLEPLKETEVEPYIACRLDSVGWNKDPSLSQGIYSLIHRYSEGVPGSINLVCGRLLAQACAEDRHIISIEDTRTAILQLQSEGLGGTALSADDAQSFEENASETVLPGTSGRTSVEDSNRLREEAALSGVTAIRPDTNSASDLEDEPNRVAQIPEIPKESRKSPRLTTTGKRKAKRRRNNSMIYLTSIALILLLWLGWLRDFAGIREIVATHVWLPAMTDSIPASSSDTQVPRVDTAAEITDSSIRQPGSLPEPVRSSVATPKTGLISGSAPAPDLGDASVGPDTNMSAVDPLAIADADDVAEAEIDLNCEEKFQIKYESNSSRLSDEAQGLLSELARHCLGSSLNKVRVTGYTDTSGDWDYNLRLSQRRAEQVAEYLITQGVSPGSIFAEGLGEYGFDQPASAPETTRAEDRRIVLLEIQPHTDSP